MGRVSAGYGQVLLAGVCGEIEVGVNKTGEFYVVIEGVRPAYSPKGPISRIKGIGISQRQPTRLYKDQIAVKLMIEVPEEAFEPYEPVAKVVVPTAALGGSSVEVIGTVRKSDEAEIGEALKRLLTGE